MSGAVSGTRLDDLPPELKKLIVEYSGQISSGDRSIYFGQDWKPWLIDVCSASISSTPNRRWAFEGCQTLRGIAQDIERRNNEHISNLWKALTQSKAGSEPQRSPDTEVTFSASARHNARLTTDLDTYLGEDDILNWSARPDASRVPGFKTKSSDQTLTQLILIPDILSEKEQTHRQLHAFKGLLLSMADRDHIHRHGSASISYVNGRARPSIYPHLKSLIICPFSTIDPSLGHHPFGLDMTDADAPTEKAWRTGQLWTSVDPREMPLDISSMGWDMLACLLGHEKVIDAEFCFKLWETPRAPESIEVQCLPRRLSIDLSWGNLWFASDEEAASPLLQETDDLPHFDITIRVHIRPEDKMLAFNEAIKGKEGTLTDDEWRSVFSERIKWQLAKLVCRRAQSVTVSASLDWPVSGEFELEDQSKVYDFWEDGGTMEDALERWTMKEGSSITFKGGLDGKRAGSKVEWHED